MKKIENQKVKRTRTHYPITITTFERFEDGSTEVYLNENYLKEHPNNKELRDLISECICARHRSSDINGQRLFPEFIGLYVVNSKKEYSICTRYPTVRKEAE